MRLPAEMDPRTLSIIRPDCCGPFSGVWKPELRYWVCDYHCGYDDGLGACGEA